MTDLREDLTLRSQALQAVAFGFFGERVYGKPCNL